MDKRVHIVVEGLVQGVFYRASTLKTAQQLNLTGYVRNLPDGKVEIVAEGNGDQIDRLISWCRQGPTHAEVANVEVTEQDYRGEFRNFNIR